MRFMIEKLQELGIRSLVWLTCDHNQARPPSSNKIEAWVAAALEQSRGAWKLEVGGPVRLADLDAPVVLDPAGEPLSAGTALVCVGPEGGWSSAERDAAVTLGSLGDTILRTETAAIVAAARLTTHR